MNLDWSPADAAFEDEVRAFLAEELTPELRDAGQRMTSVYAQTHVNLAWQAILNRRGWAAPAWPVKYGGCAWSVVQHYIFAREKARAGAPPTSPMGIQMCGPALIGYGTDEQKAYYLPRMLSGEDLWCQGYSEPASGSDLASLQMSAVADGDSYVCNGAKVWTTHAHHANMLFCLVRTSHEARPQQGITFLLMDMRAPGVTVHPIISLTGEHIQNQIFFDNVRVPRANVVGEVGAGWTVAKYLLEFERGGAAYGPNLKARLETLARMAGATADPDYGNLKDDPTFAAKLAEAEIAISALDAAELQSMCALSQGQGTGARSSMMKLLGTELSQRLTELALEAAGVYGGAYQPQLCEPGGEFADLGALALPAGLIPTDSAIAPLRYLNDRAGTIYAGSSEIQRNILAKAELALPA